MLSQKGGPTALPHMNQNAINATNHNTSKDYGDGGDATIYTAASNFMKAF